MWTITCPVSVPVSKKGKLYILNLNVYRNTHFLVLNKAKESFREIVTPLLRDIPSLQRVKLTFTHFPGSNRLCDTSNVCAVVDKFFCDALVTAGKLEDDNYTILPNVHYEHGHVDKGNGRVEVLIEPIGVSTPSVKGNSIMQLILPQSDIEVAIANLVSDTFTLKEGATISVTIDGEVTIEIVPAGGTPSPTAEKKSRAPRGSRTVTAKPTEVVKDIAPAATTAVAGSQPVVEAESPGLIVGDNGQSGLEGEEPEPEVEDEVLAEEPVVETPPVSKANSLFAGLGRVKN